MEIKTEIKTKACAKCGNPVDRPNPQRKKICYTCLGKVFEKKHYSPDQLEKKKVQALIRRTARNPTCVYQAGMYCHNKNMPWKENSSSDYPNFGKKQCKKECSHKYNRRNCPLFKPWQSEIYAEILKNERKMMKELDEQNSSEKEKERLADLEIEQRLIREAMEEKLTQWKKQSEEQKI